MHTEKIVKSKLGIKGHRFLKAVGELEVRPSSVAMATWSLHLSRVTADDGEHFKEQKIRTIDVSIKMGLYQKKTETAKLYFHNIILCANCVILAAFAIHLFLLIQPHPL